MRKARLAELAAAPLHFVRLLDGYGLIMYAVKDHQWCLQLVQLMQNSRRLPCVGMLLMRPAQPPTVIGDVIPKIGAKLERPRYVSRPRDDDA